MSYPLSERPDDLVDIPGFLQLALQRGLQHTGFAGDRQRLKSRALRVLKPLCRPADGLWSQVKAPGAWSPRMAGEECPQDSAHRDVFSVWHPSSTAAPRCILYFLWFPWEWSHFLGWISGLGWCNTLPSARSSLHSSLQSR